MANLSWSAQLAMVVTGYAMVILFGALTIYMRHLQEASHPDDVNASSGMYAFGDGLLYMFIAFLFLIPTFFLMRMFSKLENPYTIYARILFLLSLTAPVSLVLFGFKANRTATLLSILVFVRIWWSPLMLVLALISRLAARFARAKRLTSYALAIEGATLAIAVALLFTSH